MHRCAHHHATHPNRRIRCWQCQMWSWRCVCGPLWPPKVTKQCFTIPGMWGIASNAPWRPWLLRMAWTPSCDTPEPFELSDTITGAPNVVFEVCVWAPQGVTKQCPAIPGVWGHCPQCPIVTLAAEGDLSTIIRHPNGAAQFEPTVGYTVSAMPNVVLEVCMWPPKVT